METCLHSRFRLGTARDGAYGSLSGETEAIDIDEMIASLAKVVADMTWSCDAMLCRHIFTSDNQHTGFVEPDTRAPLAHARTPLVQEYLNQPAACPCAKAGVRNAG